ncbi:MAG: hypothetical protein LBJ00_05000 [Planctomycetaceae bacterium]|nr:hypothetical protein [Planctomycetaceae bacterium]
MKRLLKGEAYRPTGYGITTLEKFLTLSNVFFSPLSYFSDNSDCAGRGFGRRRFIGTGVNGKISCPYWFQC